MPRHVTGQRYQLLIGENAEDGHGILESIMKLTEAYQRNGQSRRHRSRDADHKAKKMLDEAGQAWTQEELFMGKVKNGIPSKIQLNGAFTFSTWKTKYVHIIPILKYGNVEVIQPVYEDLCQTEEPYTWAHMWAKGRMDGLEVLIEVAKEVNRRIKDRDAEGTEKSQRQQEEAAQQQPPKRAKRQELTVQM